MRDHQIPYFYPKKYFKIPNGALLGKLLVWRHFVIGRNTFWRLTHRPLSGASFKLSACEVPLDRSCTEVIIHT